jgi:archaellum component FlaD/FlaE
MQDKKVGSKKKVSEGCDLEKELSALVSKKVIPKKIAEKLGQKLKDKNVKLSKEQLHTLVYKIREVIIDIKSGKTPGAGKASLNKNNLIETLERLEERITNIESGRPSKTRIYTTDDMNVPGRITGSTYEWDIDPLTDVPNDPESIIVLMKWLQHLVDRCGHTNLPIILDYYVDIGWITDDAKISLIDYSKGITEDEKNEELKNKTLSDLPAKDHIQSLIFIQKLKGVSFDKHFLDRIEGELSRITRKLEHYKLK